MKRVWSVEELHESWSLTSSDMARMPDKQPAGRLWFVAQRSRGQRAHGRPEQARSTSAQRRVMHAGA
jgi:hypothetical protein